MKEMTLSELAAEAEKFKTALIIDKPGEFVRVMVDIQAQLRKPVASQFPGVSVLF